MSLCDVVNVRVSQKDPVNPSGHPQYGDPEGETRQDPVSHEVSKHRSEDRIKVEGKQHMLANLVDVLPVSH